MQKFVISVTSEPERVEFREELRQIDEKLACETTILLAPQRTEPRVITEEHIHEGVHSVFDFIAGLAREKERELA